MPSFRRNKRLKKPWHARAQRDGLEFHLGYYKTREEAEAVERQFAIDVPPSARGRRKSHV